MLDKMARKDLFVTNTLKLFISFLWSKYQPRIIKWHLIPYLVYMVVFILTASSFVGEYIFQINDSSVDTAKNRPYAILILTYLTAMLISYIVTEVR